MSRKALDTSRKAYERALARTKRDEAKIAQRQAALHAVEVNLGSTNIVSPVDGTVVSRDAKIGQPVAAGPETPPLFLIDPAVIHINANAGGQDIGEIKPSNKVTFTIEAFPERSFAGEVTPLRPSPQIDAQAVVYDAVIRAPNPDLLLKPGMRAAIRIVVDRRDDVLRAPNQALRYSPGVLAVPNGSGEPGASLMTGRSSGSCAMESRQQYPSNSISTTSPTRKSSKVTCGQAMS